MFAKRFFFFFLFFLKLSSCLSSIKTLISWPFNGLLVSFLTKSSTWNTMLYTNSIRWIGFQNKLCLISRYKKTRFLAIHPYLTCIHFSLLQFIERNSFQRFIYERVKRVTIFVLEFTISEMQVEMNLSSPYFITLEKE